MRTLAVIAAVLVTVGVTAQPTLAAQNSQQLTIKTKSSPPRAPIEEKAKQGKAKKPVPDKCGPTVPGKPATSTC